MKSSFILFAHSDVELCVGTSMANGFRLNKIIEELVKEKESEKAEKEKEKAEKKAMLERMASIESLLIVVTKNLSSSS
ncbi:hypothetical protein E3N88_33151 [Mikania micrantha]|uniref:Uncharacterized protein n=1 Tax=Mikania micrantha TaxID=192012 RepID=A0A5N6MBR8_9ASTR|nr:hypothetical protein E3N88_33151 [Mikania micrantha]